MSWNDYRPLFRDDSARPLPPGGVRMTFFGTTTWLLDITMVKKQSKT